MQIRGRGRESVSLFFCQEHGLRTHGTAYSHLKLQSRDPGALFWLLRALHKDVSRQITHTQINKIFKV